MNFQLLFEKFRKAPTLKTHLLLLLVPDSNPLSPISYKKKFSGEEKKKSLQLTQNLSFFLPFFFFLAKVSFNPVLSPLR